MGPNDLTGEMVMRVRTGRKMSRNQLYQLVGWEGKSTARLMNIEQKNSWKTGDRERVWAAFQQMNVRLGELTGNDADAEQPLTGGYAAPSAPAVLAAPAAGLAVPRGVPPEVIYGYTPSTDAAVPVFCYEADDMAAEEADGFWVAPPLSRDETQSGQQYPAEPIWKSEPSLSHPDGDVYIGQARYNGCTCQNVCTCRESDRSQDDGPTLPNDPGIGDLGLYVITNGQLQDWKRCRRKWWLTWYRKLGMATQSKTDARAIGTRIHRALEQWYRADPMKRRDPREALEDVLLADWTELMTRATANSASQEEVAAITDQFKRVALLERAMIQGYVEWLQETGEDSNYVVVGSEQVVMATLDVRMRDRDVVTVLLKALLDTRIRRISDNVRLFIDHKTVADTVNPVATLHMNEQMMHYHFVEWMATEDGEERCDGALYNMLKKVKRTDRANPPFYARAEVRHSVTELENYKRQVEATIRDILDAKSDLDDGAEHHDVVYPTRTPECKWQCDFFAVCSMFDDNSRAEDALAGIYVSIDPNDRYDRVGEEQG